MKQQTFGRKIAVLAMVLCLCIPLFALAQRGDTSAAAVWEQRHNDTGSVAVGSDGVTTITSGADGKMNNDVAFGRTDETYKLKANGFYMRFTYKELDIAEYGDVVEELGNNSTIRLIFSNTAAELGNGKGTSSLVIRLNMYYDAATVAGANSVSKRNEASINYWGSRADDESGYPIDNWFFGSPYGGAFFADGTTVNTVLIKHNPANDLLWVCLNDFWYPVGEEDVEVIDNTGETWGGGQGQAHSYVEEAWVPTPGMTDLLNELDTANDGAGAYFTMWQNNANGYTNMSEMKIVSMGCPAAPVIDGEKPVSRKMNPGQVTVDLNEYFSQPNNDSMVFSAKSGAEDIGTIANGVWTYTTTAPGDLAVTFSAVSNNANLGAYFSEVRSSSFTYNIKTVSALTVKDTSALSKAAYAGSEVSISDLSAYINGSGETVTYSSETGTVTASAWKYTPDAVGAKQVSITATDGISSVNIEFTLNVLKKLASKPIDNITVKVGAEASISDLNGYFEKSQAGDTLTFTADKGTVTGSKWSFTPSAAGNTSVKITANDGANSAEATFSVKAVAALTLKDTSALSKTVYVGEEVSITDLSAYINGSGETVTYSSETGTVTANAWKYTPDTAGAKQVSITAADGFSTVNIEFTITVLKKLAAKPVSNITVKVGAEASINDLNTYFEKAQAGDTLTFIADKGTVAGSKWTFTPSEEGDTTVKITANDGTNSAEITFKVIAEKEDEGGCKSLSGAQGAIAFFALVSLAFVAAFKKKIKV